MDPYTKRKIILGEVSTEEAMKLIKEDQEKQRADPNFFENHYGELLEMRVNKKTEGIFQHMDATCNDKQYSGMRVESRYMEVISPYFVTGSWISGKSLDVNEAFRIFEENDEIMKVREVEDMYEKDRIKDSLYEILLARFEK